MLRAWVVVHPSRHTGFTGSPALIVFEAVKTAMLLVILGRVSTTPTGPWQQVPLALASSSPLYYFEACDPQRRSRSLANASSAWI
jgi:hypothetical protein